MGKSTKKVIFKKITAIALSLSMVLAGNAVSPNSAQAKAKAPKLAKKTVSVNVGAKVNVKIKNVTPKKVTVKVKKSKIAKVKVKSKKKLIVTGIATGKTKATVKVKYKSGKKVKTSNLKLTINVTEVTATPVATAVATKAATTTTAPAVATKAPEATEVPASEDTSAPEATPTATPVITLSDGDEIDNPELDLPEETPKVTLAPEQIFDDGEMRKDMTSLELTTEEMGPGINLGNTFEATLDYDTKIVTTDPAVFETAWGSQVITQEVIDGIASYGFKTVRIPVAWSNMMHEDGTYTIDQAWMNRIEEVTNYCLKNDMYVIINDHWDSGWWGQFGNPDAQVRLNAAARYRRFWQQIGETFKNYSDHVILESGNEEIGQRLNDAVDEHGYSSNSSKRTGGKLTDAQKYQLTNQINQTFVNIIRAQGGNNAYRHLLIAGYDTNIGNTCKDKFVMPTDTEENGVSKLSVSVHFYSPWGYCGDNGSTVNWGVDDLEGDQADMREELEPATKFVDAGYGVIVGEYGVCVPQHNNIPKYFESVINICKDLKYLPVLWDTAGRYIDRNTGNMTYSDIAEFFNNLTGSNGDTSSDFVTGEVEYDMDVWDVTNKEPIFSWEGKWYKNGGNGMVGDDKSTVGKEGDFVITTSCSSPDSIAFNSWGYQSFINLNWSELKNPHIRFEFAGDPGDAESNTSAGALTLAAADQPDGNPYLSVTIDYADYACTDSVKKAVAVPSLVGANFYQWLYITFADQPIVTGIYVYDEE